MASLSQTAVRGEARAVLRYLGAGILAIVGVAASGVWVGHRLDPTWAQRHAPLRRVPPFPLPPLDAGAAWSRDVVGRPWLLELRFPGCGADDTDVTARVAALSASVRARTGRDPGWVTLLVGGLPGAAGASARHVAPLDPGRLADVAAQLGLADSARAAADGLLDARHWMFAVDGGGWVRGAAEVSGSDHGWSALEQAFIAAAEAPLAAPRSDAPASAPLTAAARLPDFRAVDQDGRPVTGADLAGHPVVVDFIFTRCTGACPMLTARLATLRRMVTAAEVRFVSFSVDPANDTPQVLRTYAARWGASDPRWRLLSADAHTVRAVARALGESVVQTDGGPILHSDHFTLIDRSGVVRSRAASGDVAAVRSLAAELSAAPAASRNTDGARLFSALGCRGCHDNAALAPALVGVAGGPVRLAGGRTVAADDNYLRQSITAPVADVVDGFGPTMPSYGGLLSDGEVTALVDYIKAFPR